MASDYEKKLLELRLQMNENQAHMQDYFSDLDRWTNDMKEKEAKLLEKADPTSSQDKVIEVTLIIAKLLSVQVLYLLNLDGDFTTCPKFSFKEEEKENCQKAIGRKQAGC
jgi:hypothetical protein